MKATSIRLTDEQVDWLDEQVEANRFGSVTHGVRYCISEVMKREG